MMLGLGDAIASGSVEAGVMYDAGPMLPPGYVAQPFNCPAGAAFAASQEMGMCAAADYTPLYVTDAAGTKRFFNLDGSMTWTQPAASAAGDWIPGLPNALVFGALGLLLVMKMAR